MFLGAQRLAAAGADGVLLAESTAHCDLQQLGVVPGLVRRVVSNLSREHATRPLNPGLNCWVVDSGSGYNSVPRRSVANKERITKADNPLTLQTTNGISKSFENVEVDVPALGIQVAARILDDTPLVLSLEDLIGNYSISISWSTPKSAWLKRRSRKVELEVTRGVPALRILKSQDPKKGAHQCER